jgi:hypothetical protein
VRKCRLRRVRKFSLDLIPGKWWSQDLIPKPACSTFSHSIPYCQNKQAFHNASVIGNGRQFFGKVRISFPSSFFYSYASSL